ncbi:hypothetical protein VTJ49DRAFT_811 [Mycothermus thermophilus]|uniref:Nucleoporin POM33 n=1 Tax=Humicola insolens TaxID=85995 RepID=A0ABR3VG28_HUMIN
MAPPPPADLPLAERFQRILKTLQFAWFSGHALLLFCVVRYGFSWLRMNYYGGMAQFCYRFAFLAAAWTYGIVVYKTLRARQRTGGSDKPLHEDENVQYLGAAGMAFVWLFMPQYPLALLPYAIYSIFHVATYVRATLVPTISPPQQLPPAPGASPNAKPQYAQHPISEQIGWFVKRYYESSMAVVANLEIGLWFRILLSALVWQRRSWILLAIYTAFLRSRLAQSSHVQDAFAQLEARIDNLIGAQGTPPAARQIWDGIKQAARQFYTATNPRNFTGGASVPTKKTN